MNVTNSPTAADVLTDRLAEAVELMNATTDPAERVELFHEVARLRVQIVCAREEAQ